MIPIKPFVQHEGQCPHCGDKVRGGEVLWQGIHVCVSTWCEGCGREYIEDMPVGHATYSPYRVEVPNYTLTGDAKSRKWLGEPLRQALLSPSYDLAVGMTVHKMKPFKRIIIVNTIDYLYGHALLKLLNVQREYEQSPELGIVVIVQKSLEWMVPACVAEIWTVDVPFSKARNFYPVLHHRMIEELVRFDEVHVSPAYSHLVSSILSSLRVSRVMRMVVSRSRELPSYGGKTACGAAAIISHGQCRNFRSSNVGLNR